MAIFFIFIHSIFALAILNGVKCENVENAVDEKVTSGKSLDLWNIYAHQPFYESAPKPRPKRSSPRGNENLPSSPNINGQSRRRHRSGQRGGGQGQPPPFFWHPPLAPPPMGEPPPPFVQPPMGVPQPQGRQSPDITEAVLAGIDNPNQGEAPQNTPFLPPDEIEGVLDRMNQQSTSQMTNIPPPPTYQEHLQHQQQIHGEQQNWRQFVDWERMGQGGYALMDPQMGQHFNQPPVQIIPYPSPPQQRQIGQQGGRANVPQQQPIPVHRPPPPINPPPSIGPQPPNEPPPPPAAGPSAKSKRTSQIYHNLDQKVKDRQIFRYGGLNPGKRIKLSTQQQKDLIKWYAQNNPLIGDALKNFKGKQSYVNPKPLKPEAVVEGFRDLYKYGHIGKSILFKEYNIPGPVLEDELDRRGVHLFEPQKGGYTRNSHTHQQAYDQAREQLQMHMDRREAGHSPFPPRSDTPPGFQPIDHGPYEPKHRPSTQGPRNKKPPRQINEQLLQAEQQRWMQHVAGHPVLGRFQMPEEDQRTIAQIFRQYRPSNRPLAEVREDLRNLAAIGIRPHIIQHEYLLNTMQTGHIRQLVDRTPTPVEINNLPETMGEMREATRNMAWEHLRGNYANMPSANSQQFRQWKQRINAANAGGRGGPSGGPAASFSGPSTSGTSGAGGSGLFGVAGTSGAGSSRGPSAAAPPIRPIRPPTPSPRGGPGGIHPPPNLTPSTKRHRQSSSSSNSSGSAKRGRFPSPKPKKRFERRKKRNAQFA